MGYSAVIFAWMTVLSAEANVRACVRRYCSFVWLVASTYVCYVTEANVRACVRTSVWCGVVGWVEFICMCVYLCVQLLSCPPRPTYVRACMRACLRKLEWCGVVWYGMVEWLDVYVRMTVLRLVSVTINQTTTQNPSPNVTPTKSIQTIPPNQSTN